MYQNLRKSPKRVPHSRAFFEVHSCFRDHKGENPQPSSEGAVQDEKRILVLPAIAVNSDIQQIVDRISVRPSFEASSEIQSITSVGWSKQ